jgi:hypothetical protein
MWPPEELRFFCNQALVLLAASLFACNNGLVYFKGQCEHLVPRAWHLALSYQA